MGLSVQTAATQEPVRLEEAKRMLRVTVSDEDQLIRNLIIAAREYCETFTGRQFVSATYDYTLDAWSDPILLPKPPLSSVTSISYVDEDGATQTLSSAIYDVVTNVEPGRVRLAYDQSWPTIRAQDEAITIRFVAGYGDPDDVPETVCHAINLLVGHLFEHREAVIRLARGQMMAELPLALKSLLWRNRIYEAM